MSSDHATTRYSDRPRRLVLSLLLACGFGGGALADSAPDAVRPEFSGERALAWIEIQCEMGPRIPGSSGNLRLRERIVSEAEQAGLSVWTDCFEGVLAVRGDTVQICNLVVSAGPSGGERLWLGAHFDTRPVSDRDPDPALRATPLVGANDGASGTAVLLHLMEIMGRQPPPRGVDLLFFDGEDSGEAGAAAGYCLGSRRLAAHWQDFGNPLSIGRPRGLIVLDMVGGRDLLIAKEAYSASQAPAWTDEVFARALGLGLTVFEPGPGRAVYDDHVPFLQRGIPAVDLIDLDYAQWHTAADTPAHCDAGNLAQVGRLVVDLVYHP